MSVNVAGSKYLLRLKRVPGRLLVVDGLSDKPVSVTVVEADRRRVELILNGERFSYRRSASPVGELKPVSPASAAGKGSITAPMPGKVVGVLVTEGGEVKAGDPLVILESMKMEIAVRGDRDAKVRGVLVVEGQAVKRGQALVRLAD